MIKKFVILLFFACCLNSANASDYRYFTENWFSIYEGFRNISTRHTNVDNQLNFLNYMYTQEDEADYQYLEIATRLRRENAYQIDASIAIYNTLIPYCYNVSYTRFVTPKLGIIAGSMANRFYLTEFNGMYNILFSRPITTRYVERQWNLSLIGFYIGPTYQIKYKTLTLNLDAKGGMATFYPFDQINIIKEAHSNYKMVLDYKTRVNFAPFIMPKVELAIDFFQYKKAIIGSRFKFNYLYTKTSINYDLKTYEWTYNNPELQIIRLSKRSFHQYDWDIGVFIRW